MSDLLNLSAPRSITLHDRNRKFTLLCRRVTKEDWLAYFAAIRVTSENTQEGRVSSQDFQTAQLVLAERVLTGAEGYTVAGGAELTSLPDWQSKIPLNHRLQLGMTLADVAVSESLDEFVIHPEGEEVLLDAIWPGEDGAMLRYNGLKHIFKTPTPAQHKRFRDAASRSLLIGGSRTGRTVYLGAHATLCELYDELILAVEGYCADIPDALYARPDIIAHMDTYHKFVAAKELFNPTPTAYTAAVAPEAAPAE